MRHRAPKHVQFISRLTLRASYWVLLIHPVSDPAIVGLRIVGLKKWFRYDTPDKRLFKELQKTLMASAD